MPFENYPTFTAWLKHMQLVPESQLDAVFSALPGANQTVKDVIGELERRNLLTPYQVSRLRREETDGLRMGPYVLLYRNASGSFARVFRGRSITDGSVVGLKILRQRWADDPRAVSFFKREGDIGKTLKHKNIVPIYEVGSTPQNEHYFTMEFIEGGNLRDILKIRGKFSIKEATKVVFEIAEGLHYALAMGMTHRDLKLTNVLLSTTGEAKLVDFGLAGAGGDSQIDEEIDCAVEYATLERHTHAPDGDPRSDLYFLGAIYFELLVGDPPYAPTSEIAERKNFTRYRGAKHIRQLAPSMAREVVDVVDRLMVLNPNDRYQSAYELMADLQKILGADSPPLPLKNPVPKEGDDSGSNSQPSGTLLCMEPRASRLETLRKYFVKHGFTVETGTEIDAVCHQITETNPRAVIIGSTAIEGSKDLIIRAAGRCRTAKSLLIVLLADAHRKLKKEIPEVEHVRLVDNSTTLRELRDMIQSRPVAAE